MADVVAVHGVGQQQLGRQQLLAQWTPAIGDGLERALGRPVPPPDLDLVFYGNLFVPGEAAPAARTKSASDDPGWDDVDPAERDELLELGRQAAGPEALDAAERQELKGHTRVPRPVQLVLRALDWRFGPGAALLFVGVFRQVRRYLRDPVLKTGVDELARKQITGDCRVLVAHSLGSIVAFEHLRQHPDSRVDLLLTLGSPLGARFVRALMPDPRHGADGLPSAVRTWVNVRDARDPVTFAGPLDAHWPRVRDVVVDNQGDAHAATRYLSKRGTGSALLATAPELAG